MLSFAWLHPRLFDYRLRNYLRIRRLRFFTVLFVYSRLLPLKHLDHVGGHFVFVVLSFRTAALGVVAASIKKKYAFITIYIFVVDAVVCCTGSVVAGPPCSSAKASTMQVFSGAFLRIQHKGWSNIFQFCHARQIDKTSWTHLVAAHKTFMYPSRSVADYPQPSSMNVLAHIEGLPLALPPLSSDSLDSP